MHFVLMKHDFCLLPLYGSAPHVVVPRVQFLCPISSVHLISPPGIESSYTFSYLFRRPFGSIRFFPHSLQATMSESFMFTSESVGEGHPGMSSFDHCPTVVYSCSIDKICDQVSDAILDACLEQDPYSRVACGKLTPGLLASLIAW